MATLYPIMQLLIGCHSYMFLFVVVVAAGFNWTRDDLENHGKAPLTFHNIVEAFKFAYAPSTFLGDPKFTNFTKEVRAGF